MSDFEVRYGHTPSGAAVAYGTSGDGPTVVHLPPALFSSFQEPSHAVHRWPGIFSDWRTVAYDHVGGGLSDREGYDYSSDGLRDECLAVLDAADVDRAVLFGMSVTSVTAMRLAVEQPQRVAGLVLVRAWARGRDYLSDQFRGYRTSLEGDWDVATATMAAFLSPTGSDERRLAEQ